MIRRENQSHIYTALLTTAMLSHSAALAQSSVQYEFEFLAEWSEQTHPLDFPSNPHFSPIIGASHNDMGSVWAPNEIASHGIEQMAERGVVNPLNSEINVLISAGVADQFFSLGGIASSPGVRSNTITIDAQYSLISLVTMLAPSPDWFVGIHDLDVRPNGVWTHELIIDVYPYDSGTDSGSSYNSPNADITPHVPIQGIQDQFPFAGTARIGTFRLTLLSPAGCSIADFAQPYDSLDFFDISAYVNAFTKENPLADLNDDGELNFFDVSAFLNDFLAGCP